MLGLSIGELLDSPAIEIDAWARYFDIRPPFNETVPQLLAEQASMFFNSHIDPKKTKQRTALDFMFWKKQKITVPEQEKGPVDISDILGVDGLG